MKELWVNYSDFITFILIVSIVVLVFWTVTPMGHTITKYELERAQEFCGDSGIYKFDTYCENRVVCNDGTGATFYKLNKKQKE